MARGTGRDSDGWHPLANKETFRDLLVFEERLKQNAERLAKTRRKYEAFLASLVSLIVYFGYYVWIAPSIYTIIHYLNVTLLLVLTVTFLLFFVTGMYQEKITYAHKFVPQANRALRPFNIYLNTRSRFFWAKRPPPPVPRSPQPLSRSPSTSSTASSVGAKSPPASPRLRPSAVPIPPAVNPRGELIFSTRVAAAFREGYERYRSEWERRRVGNPKGSSSYSTGLLSWLPFRRRRRRQVAASTTPHHASGRGGSEDTTSKERKRTPRSRTASNATAQSTSRSSSPTRGASPPASPRRRPVSPPSRRRTPSPSGSLSKSSSNNTTEASRRERSSSVVSNASSVENHPPASPRQHANASRPSTTSRKFGDAPGRPRAESFTQVLDELQEEAVLAPSER